ncbi:MAG: aminodeoxychorismate synthase component I [Thermoanaerobaculia bacterium]
MQDTGAGDHSRWLRFRKPSATLAARRVDEVLPVLARVEEAVAAGSWAAGFIAYEAAPAFDAALAAHPPGPLPLTWWGIFEPPDEVPPPESTEVPAGIDWRPAIADHGYREAIARIRARIAAGDTYQVNYTFPLEARWHGDPAALFAALSRAQQARYCAYLDIGRFAVCSASPELFFELDGDRILTRPMKGTARRGRYPEEDRKRARELLSSAKDLAENVMIVDMMRNDLGKIAHPGSVTVDELFAVETYPTLHQLTSTISAATDASLVDILRALFPCASITGAPKVSTTRIIRELETGPRGVYTGAIGFAAPGRRARFNVAIRTAVVDRETATARYGTGGGIVWDSDADSEYRECRTKALVLRSPTPDFSLLETLLWRPRSGFFLLERHLERLRASAGYFGFAVDPGEVRERLQAAAQGFADVRHRLRLLAGRRGEIEIESTPWPARSAAPRTVWSVCLDEQATDSENPFLFHKTTHRDVYDQARHRVPHCDEVVLWNERRELTESTRANLVLRLDGELVTPPVDCGLLAGTYRVELIDRGRIREQVLPLAALAAAEAVFLVNSVRGWIRTRRAGEAS